MPRVLIRGIDTDPLRLAEQARARGIDLAPDFAWTDNVIVVIGSDPVNLAGLEDVGPTAFNGIPPIPHTPPGPVPPATMDAAWLAATSATAAYFWEPDDWHVRASGRRVRLRTAVRLQRHALSRAAVIRHRAAAQTAWLLNTANNPVVPAAVVRITSAGDCLLQCAYDHRVLLPLNEQIRPHALGERLAVRLTTSLGGRATERDTTMLRGLGRRVMGSDYRDPVLDVWPNWPQAPRLAFVLAAPGSYRRWVDAAPTLSALSGRRIRVFRDATPPTELARQALRSAICRISEGRRALYITVPPAELGRWLSTYGRILPLVDKLVGRPVWVRATAFTP